MTSNTLIYNGNPYRGELSNGKPHGVGLMALDKEKGEYTAVSSRTDCPVGVVTT